MKKVVVLLILTVLSINIVYAKEKVTFDSCVDGDTFKILLNGEKKSVRMIAIDTPESVHPTKEVEYYGKEASEYTCNKLKNASKIELEYDENSDSEDKYERLIAWVFVDDLLLQEDLIENGYAKVAYLYDDYKYTSILEEKQELASAKNIGIWSQEQDNKNNKEYSTKEIIIIIVLIIIILVSGNKTLKRKAKSKLKKYLK